MRERVTNKMAEAKYKFTPYDIANYLLIANLSHSSENDVIDDFFDNHNHEIISKFRSNDESFRNKVHDIIIQNTVPDNDYDEYQLIKGELGLDNTECVTRDPYGNYFKLIKLQLLYSNIDYRKIKLTSLLNAFNHKRRSATIIDGMKKALNALGLKTYLKDYESCDIADINVNQMIMIRMF